MPNEQVCDPQRIDDYLEERLSDVLIGEFEQHLCDCERCRMELQKRSAEPDVWRDAVALLGTDSTQFTPSVRNSLSNERHDPISGELSVDESKIALRERYVLSVLDSLAPTDDPDMLGRVGDYEISGVVGVGGMGAVLKGFDKSLRRVVAIKVMAPHLAHSGSARTRFQREARAAAAITHDNVIDIYAVSEAAGLPYLVMPYARGPSLQKRIDEGGPLGVVEVVRIGRQIAAGLAAAHDQGLVHRDIKPANILLSDGIERLWITDFGVARAMDDASMTQTGLIAGTPQYMSPEQARGETVDHRSDLFSLGSVLYTACTGRPPFRSEAAYGILRRITDSDPRPIREINADIPEWLCLIITRLLAKHPADRFETAAEVVELLDGCLAHLQQPLHVELPSSLRSKPTKGDNQASLSDVINPSETKPFPIAQQTPLSQPIQPPRRHFPKRGVIMTGSIFLTALLGILAIQWTNPTDISGHWTGENWRHVSLVSVDEASDWYSGTFVDSAGRRGALRLEWSRLQRRYNGRWKVGDAEAGQITLRGDKDGALRGALSVDPESQLESDTPRLQEFAWLPASKEAEQNFASQTAATTSKERIPDRQAINRAVSIASPTEGVIVKLAEGLKMQARFKKGDFIAEIEKLDPAIIEEREKQRAAIKRKLDASGSAIQAARKNLDAAMSICTAVEAQVKTQQTLQQKTLEAIKAGRESLSAELQVQGNLDTAVVALKKAEADVVKMESALEQAFVEHGDLSNEIDEIDSKFQNLARLRIVAPMDGTVTYLGKLDAEKLKEGEVICELTPDLEEPSALLKKSDDADFAPVPTTSPAVTSTLLEPPMNDSLQSLSAFGPASGLAKRMRDSQQRLARISVKLDEEPLVLQRIQRDLQELLAQQQKNKEDGNSQIREQRIAQLEHIQQAKEKELRNLTADKALAEAEWEEAKHEQHTILKILEVQLSAAIQKLRLQEESKEHTELLFEKGAVGKEELSKVEQAVAIATSEVRQLEVLRNYYFEIGRN